MKMISRHSSAHTEESRCARRSYSRRSRATFREALKSKKRDAVVRHHALHERARTYEAEGKRTMARKDLERIMAKDSTYPGLSEALAELT